MNGQARRLGGAAKPRCLALALRRCLQQWPFPGQLGALASRWRGAVAPGALGVLSVPLIFLAGAVSVAMTHPDAAPLTLAEGLYSGVLHPLLEADHLGMLVGIGVIAVMAGGSFRLPLAYSVATFVGIHLPAFGLRVPGNESMLALSVLGCGVALACRSKVGQYLLPGIVAAGLVHGYDYGEHLVHAPAVPIVVAVLSIMLVQAALISAAYAAGRWCASRWQGNSYFFERAGAYLLLTGMVVLVLAGPPV